MEKTNAILEEFTTTIPLFQKVSTQGAGALRYPLLFCEVE